MKHVFTRGFKITGASYSRDDGKYELTAIRRVRNFARTVRMTFNENDSPIFMPLLGRKIKWDKQFNVYVDGSRIGTPSHVYSWPERIITGGVG